MGKSVQRLNLANDRIERVFATDDGRFRTLAVVNVHNGDRLNLEADEFRLVWMDGRETSSRKFTHESQTLETQSDGVQVLSVKLRHPELGIRAEIRYWLGDNEAFMRKQVVLAAECELDQTLDRIDVETFACDAPLDATLEFQPVFISDRYFVGLEYPAGVNRVDGRTVSVSHYPGTKIGPAPWRSKTAVLGVSSSGTALSGFLKYVERVRRRHAPRLYWNTGGEMQIYEPIQLRKQSMRLSEALALAVERLQNGLTRERGVPLACFEIEPSWHDSGTLYEVDRTKFPDGLQTLAHQAHSTGSGLGLWLSPTTPICPALMRREMLNRNGYAIAKNTAHPGEYPCLSAEPYRTAIRDAMHRIAKELGVAQFKMDFSFMDCEADKHGHLPTARHGREANVDALIELMTSLHSLNPEIVTIPTSGMWLSPWWLMYADVIWPHGMVDFTYERRPVSVNPRDWELTMRDQELHRLFRAERGRAPFSGIMSMAMYAGPRYNVAGPNESRLSYLRHVVYNMGRQVKCPLMYLDGPPSDSSDDWDVTGKAAFWYLDRCARVAEGEVVLGEPAKGEVYGFRHVDAEGGVLTLRNPSMSVQTAALPSNDIAFSEAMVVEQVFPYRRFLGMGDADALRSLPKVSLDPHGVAVVEVNPLRAMARPLLKGCRYALIEERDGEAIFEVYSRPGESLGFECMTPGQLIGLWVEGRVVVAAEAVSLPALGRLEQVAVSRLADRTGEEVAVTGEVDHVAMQTYRLDIPDDRTAMVRILTDDELLHPLKISVNTGGMFGGLPYRVCRGKGWTAYDLDLNPRDMNIVAWGFPSKSAPRSARMWLLQSWKLLTRRVVVRYEPPNDRRLSPELPAPFAGLVEDALCISGLGLTPDQRPWMDEYAREKD